MTKTVASLNICINKEDRKQAKRDGEKINKRRAKLRFFDSMILLKHKCIQNSLFQKNIQNMAHKIL